jgi:hypothetical protein
MWDILRGACGLKKAKRNYLQDFKLEELAERGEKNPKISSAALSNT